MDVQNEKEDTDELISIFDMLISQFSGGDRSSAKVGIKRKFDERRTTPENNNDELNLEKNVDVQTKRITRSQSNSPKKTSRILPVAEGSVRK